MNETGTRLDEEMNISNLNSIESKLSKSATLEAKPTVRYAFEADFLHANRKTSPSRAQKDNGTLNLREADSGHHVRKIQKGCQREK
jgi:hypothetical protein